MEKAIIERTDRFVIVRPSLLTNGKARGRRKIRVGTEAEPAVGYTISREDVGLWMFEHLVKGIGNGIGDDEVVGGRYVGQKVTITY